MHWWELSVPRNLQCWFSCVVMFDSASWIVWYQKLFLDYSRYWMWPTFSNIKQSLSWVRLAWFFFSINLSCCVKLCIKCYTWLLISYSPGISDSFPEYQCRGHLPTTKWSDLLQEWGLCVKQRKGNSISPRAQPLVCYMVLNCLPSQKACASIWTEPVSSSHFPSLPSD